MPRRAAASVLYRSLKLAEEAIAGGARQAKKIIQEIKRMVESEPMAEFEYAFVADPESLDPVSKIVGTVLIGVGATDWHHLAQRFPPGRKPCRISRFLAEKLKWGGRGLRPVLCLAFCIKSNDWRKRAG